MAAATKSSVVPELPTRYSVGGESNNWRIGARGATLALKRIQWIPGLHPIEIRNCCEAFGHTAILKAFQNAASDFLLKEGKAEMICPLAVDVDVAPTETFIAKTELCDHPQGGRVFGTNAHLHAVEALFEKKIIRGHRDGQCGEALACCGFRHPIPQVR